MEDKERYGITDAHYLCDSAIFNTETNDILRLYQICDLLNQQDKRIKELEQENQQLKQQLAEKDEQINMLEEHKFYADNIIQSYADKCKSYEEKLAEKEKENDTLTAKLEQANEIINNPDTLIFQQQELIDNLQSQLAEKERQLKLAEELLIKQEKEYDEQLHDLPKKIVEEIIEELCNCGKTFFEDEPYIEICIVQGILDTILKKYGVENERK